MREIVLDYNEILVIGLFILAMCFCNWWINMIIKKDEKCLDKKGHDWKFDHRSEGNTGDLGFGIKGFWKIDYYRCTRCGKEKRVEL